MKATRSLPLAFAALLLGHTAASAGLFQPGEILVGKFRSVQSYSAAGALEHTYSGTNGGFWGGASLTPDGNLVTSWRFSPNAGIEIFNPTGTQITAFSVANYGSAVGDVSVFADGTLALVDRINSNVKFLSQSGTLLNTVSLTTTSPFGISSGIAPFGSTVGTDNNLYVVSGTSSWMAKVNESGTVLGMIHLSFQPGDLVMSPTDGTLWVSVRDTALIEHITTDGTVLGSVASGLAIAPGAQFNGLGIAPDGNSLYAMTTSSTVIRHLDLNGNQLGDITIASPDSENFLTVVPNSVPEPGNAGIVMAFCLGAVVLLGRAPRPLR